MAGSRRRARFRLNVRFVAKLLAVVLVATGGLYLLHRLQRGRQADVFLQQATAAEDAGDIGKAADYLGRYLLAVPGDHDARGRYGLALARLATNGRAALQAYLVLDEAVRYRPDRTDLRRRAAEIGLALGSELVGDVKLHLDKLIAAAPADGELEELMAHCLQVQGQYEEAADRLARAVKKTPDLHAAAVRRAFVLRDRLGRPEEADTVVEELQAAHPKSAPAQLAAADYWGVYGNLTRQEEAIAAAAASAPTDLEVELAVVGLACDRAAQAAAQGETQAARAAYDKARAGLAAALDRHAGGIQPVEDKAVAGLPAEVKLRRARVGELYRLAAVADSAAGRPAEAEATARRGMAAVPEAARLRIALIDVLIGRGQFDPAASELERLEAGGYPPTEVAYLRGQLLAGRGEWLAAATALDGVVREVAVPGETVSEAVASAALLLGDCWEQLGEVDRRYTAYRLAAKVDPRTPLWVRAATKLAAVLVETGQDEEALAVYEQLRTRKAVWAAVPLARLYLRAALRQPAGKRDWGRVEAVLKTVEGPDVAAVRADLAAARDDLPAARQLLVAARAAYPDIPTPLLALAALEHRAGQPERGRELLAEARAKFGATAAVRLAEAALAVRPPGPDTAAALKRAGEGAEGLPPADARRVLRELAGLAAAAGAADLAAGFRDRLLAVAPDDLNTLLARVEDALRGTDEAAVRAAVDRVRAVDGETGTSTRLARAAELLRTVQKAPADDKDRPARLAEADELLAAVQKERPWSSRSAAARGLVADLRNDPATAIARYREAVDAGDRRPDVVGRLLQLYAARQQYREAEEVLAKLPADAAGVDGLLVVGLATQAGNLTRAAQAAERAVPADSTDPTKLLMLAQLRRAAGAAAERVEEPIRRAVALAPAEPAPRVALVQFLATAGRKPEAEAAVNEAEAAVKGPGRATALGACYAAVGAMAKAAEQFDAAVAPPDAGVPALRTAASFFLAVGAPAKAEPLCRRLLAAPGLSDDDRQFAARVLAEVLAARGDYAAARRALEGIGLLDKDRLVPLTGGETTGQLRTRAAALGAQPDARLRREAIAALEAVELRQPLATDEQLRLARLHLSVGDWPKARGRLLPLTQATPPDLTAAMLAAAGAVRLDGNPKEARRLLPAVLAARPDDPATVALHAAVLDAEGNPGEAAEVVLKYAAGGPDREAVAAGILEQLGLGDRAEPLLRRRAEAGTPGAAADLASYLGRQGRTRDALGVIRGAGGKLPPATVALLGVEALYNAPAVDPADAKLVEGWVATAPPADRPALLGVLRMAEGRYPEAVAAYQTAAARTPPDPLAMNNLGYLLAVHAGKPEEGLRWVKQAQQAAGPLPALLDTEGLILTRLGQAERAVEVLTEASQNLSDPAALVHLAQAQRAAGNPAAAAATVKLANRRKVRPIDLPPPERAGLAAVLAGRD